MSNGNGNISVSVSEQAQTVFQQIEEERQRQGRFIKLQSGEIRTLQFNPNKVQLTEDEFEGKRTKRVHYSVIDPQTALEGEKTFAVSLTNAISINALLKKGLNLLEIKRMGTDRNTKYTFAPQ
ncbi:MAG: hypothetical protein ABJB85_09160 [Nitrososphaerota archaeon]